MKGINLNRVLLGGVLAAIVMMLGEFLLWGVVLERQYEAMLAANGLTESSWAMAAYPLGTLILGIALAFTYAAMRPRFGARWQTGATAGALIWVVGFALPMLWNGAIGLGMGAGAATTALVWAAVETGLAGVAAAWTYQEQEARAGARAPATY